MNETRGLPCANPECNSSDAVVDYGDHTFCFSCRQRKSTGEASGSSNSAPPKALIPKTSLDFISLTKRQIPSHICKKYSYGIAPDGNHVACFYKGHELVAQHCRTKDKDFYILGKPTVATKILWGRHIYGDAGGQKLVITEGQIDCLSAATAFESLDVAVVSIPCGVNSAKAAIQANIKWIESFKEVFLAFDNDEPGQAALNDIAPLINPGKLKLLNIPVDYKDVNDLLVAEGSKGVTLALYNPKEYKPDAIIMGHEVVDSIGKTLEPGFRYPWEGMNRVTLGLRKHDFVVIGAGTGVGKTTMFKEIELGLLKQGQRLGIIHFEEQKEDTILGLMAKDEGLPYHLPDSGIPLEVIKGKAIEFTARHTIALFDKTKGFDPKLVLDTMRFMVLGLNCDFIFLDHFTALVDLCSSGNDANQMARNIVVELGKIAATLPVGLVAISHLRKTSGSTPYEEGGQVALDDLYGAAALKQWATDIWAIERNQQAEKPEDRNKATLRCLKERLRGKTGEKVYCEYNPETFVMKEVAKHEVDTNGKSCGFSDETNSGTRGEF